MLIAIIILFCFVLFLFLLNFFSQRKVLRIFKEGNVMVTGLRGRGKDCLFCFIINKRKKNYISNVQYSNPDKSFKRFDFDTKVWELAGNKPTDFIDNTLTPYTYPYPDGIDYYISDCGIYFPSHAHSQLEKRYPSAPITMALSRHLGDCNIHCNSQRIGRVWDKIREQSDLYLGMRKCVIPNRLNPFKIGYMSLSVYDNEEACQQLIKKPFFGFGSKARDRKALFVSSHGEIKNIRFLFKLPYNYDSRRFKRLLENNCVDYESGD